VTGTQSTPDAPKHETDISKLDTRIVRVDPRSLKLLEVNAHYMDDGTFQQLVENIKRDGELMSTPVVYRGVVLSGNHRTKAAIAAGLSEIEVKEILTELTAEHQLAIQLSQNAINGKDDPNILAKLYTSVASLEFRRYTGLTDDAFKCDEAKLASMGVTRPKYESLEIVFLPEDKAAFLELLERVEKSKKAKTIVVGSLDDFDAIFNAVVDAKQKTGILNNALALRAIARIAAEVLAAADQADAAERPASERPTGTVH
jgi:hypothetical protein